MTSCHGSEPAACLCCLLLIPVPWAAPNALTPRDLLLEGTLRSSPLSGVCLLRGGRCPLGFLGAAQSKTTAHKQNLFSFSDVWSSEWVTGSQTLADMQMPPGKDRAGSGQGGVWLGLRKLLREVSKTRSITFWLSGVCPLPSHGLDLVEPVSS